MNEGKSADVAAAQKGSIGWLHAHPGRSQKRLMKRVPFLTGIINLLGTRRTRFIRFCVILIRAAAHPRRTSTYYTCVSESGWNTSERRAHQLLCPFHAGRKSGGGGIKSGASELFSCACLLSNYWNSSLLQKKRPLARQVISFDLLCGER